MLWRGFTTGKSVGINKPERDTLVTHSPVKETLLVENDDQSVNTTGGAISHVFTFPPFVFDVFAPSLSVFLHRTVRMRLHQSLLRQRNSSNAQEDFSSSLDSR